MSEYSHIKIQYRHLKKEDQLDQRYAEIMFVFTYKKKREREIEKKQQQEE